MRKRNKIPFVFPTSPEWLEAVKQGFHWQARFYLWLAIALLVVPAAYLTITWLSLKGDTEKIRPGYFSLVSFSDVYAEVNMIANTWSPDSELIEARFSVYPNNEHLVNSLFTYQSESRDDLLPVSALYEDELYTVRPVQFFAGFSRIAIVEPGKGSPLPKHLLFDDSLLAFELVKSQNEMQITKDYRNINWPMILIFTDQGTESNWELCYTFKNKEGQTCFAASPIEQAQ